MDDDVVPPPGAWGGQMLTERLVLEHLGEGEAAARVMAAIEQVTANPALHTRDLGGAATTAQVTQAVCELLAAGARQAA